MIKKLLLVSLGLILMVAVTLEADREPIGNTENALPDDRDCIWNPGDPYKMHYPQLPDEDGWDVNATEPIVLADDFRCNETGWIKDIHFWGSWKHDDIGQIMYFVLSLHEDIPADLNPEGYSKPGITLWELDVPIENVNVIPFYPPTVEGWYDPSTGEVIDSDHQTYFQYNVCLDEPDWIWQEQDTIYWLNISAVVMDPVTTQWGWKNSEDHWMDDAVWAYWGELDWQEIYEPGSGSGEPITNQFWIEFGPDGQPVPGNMGGTDYYDDGNSLYGWYHYTGIDDWWNIWFYDHPYDPTRYKEIVIDFEWTPTGESYWIAAAVNWATAEWSIDQPVGDSAPPLPGVDENLYIHREYLGISTPGPYQFAFTVPDYNPEWVSVDFFGGGYFVEGTITHQCLPADGDPVSLDLAFVITGGPPDVYDFGDVPDPNYPTLLASNGARHAIVPTVLLGHVIDAELDGQPSFDALGDDKNPMVAPDDEDGVVFTSLAVQGEVLNIKVTASVAGFLNAWIDFNADGDWDDYAENIFSDEPLNPGINNLTYVVPASAAVGVTYSRFRFNTTGGLGYDGLAEDGEVEDYRVFILKPIEDAKMHWPQTPDLDNTGMDVDMFWVTLADDFLCTLSGPILDIHFWGSFADDILPAGGPESLILRLNIYSDIPADANPNGPWSQPGEVLWTKTFYPGEYFACQVADNNPEDWYDPATGMWFNDNHLNAYQYDFFIHEEEAFYQEEGTIYWLGIKDSLALEPDYTFGWKTTTIDLRWNDDATCLIDPPFFWLPMIYPPGHEYMEESLDLAFVITGGGPEVLCGDANGSGFVDIDDVVYLINYIFAGGPAPIPMTCVGDANGSGFVDIDDVVYLINYIFAGGPPPDPDCCNPPWMN